MTELTLRYGGAPSLAGRALIFFASNPEVWMTTGELRRKFNALETGNVRDVMNRLVDCGYLVKGWGGWRAGPVIRQELGYED